MTAGAAERGDHVVVIRRADLAREHDERLVGDGAQVDHRLPCQPVAAGDAQHEDILPERDRPELRRDRRAVEKSGIDLAMHQFVDLLGHRGFMQYGLHARAFRG